jgi:hypothetical protein
VTILLNNFYFQKYLSQIKAVGRQRLNAAARMPANPAVR